MSSKHPISRRQLFTAASAFAGASVFGAVPFKALADQLALAPADHSFIFVYFANGWDVLLSLDPRDQDVFTADRLTDTRILPGYSLLSNDSSFPTRMIDRTQVPTRNGVPCNIDFGPAMGRMVNHYDLMSVVRGIQMNTVAHEVGFRYFLTGKEPSGSTARGSSVATEIVGQMKPKNPIGALSYNIESYNDRFPGYANALRVQSSNDLILTLSPSPTAIDSEIEKQLVDLRGKPISCEADIYNSRGLITRYGESKQQVGSALGAKLDAYFKFEPNTAGDPGVEAEKAAMRSKYGLRPEGANDPRTSAAGRAALVATAIKRGVSQCVSITLTSGLDTHFGTQVTHAVNQRAGWNALADLVDDLRTTSHPTGGNFMDHTTILVFSEFSRTPMINTAGGRDHHVTNSCLLLGKGVKHNFVFGRSGDVGMAPGLIDFATGKSIPAGAQILPEHVIATVLAAAKLDYSNLRVDPLTGLLAE